MQILNFFRNRKAKALTQKGIGIFSPAFITSFLQGTCTNCRSPVSDFTIFGNALVVAPGTVSLQCAACRKLPEPLPRANFLRGNVNRTHVLLSLVRFRSEFNLKDIEIVLALRCNYGYFQSGGTHARGFRVKSFDSVKDMLYSSDPFYKAFEYEAPLQQRYGCLHAIGNCGECSAWWPRNQSEIEEYREGRKLFDGTRRWREDACWACGCPHQAQWHLRASLEQENTWLAEWQKVYDPSQQDSKDVIRG